MGFQLIVIGAGPGGYVAAVRAAQLGLGVAVVEKAELGGTCLNWGCIPTKALVASTDLLAAVREGGRLGVAVSGVQADFQAMMAHKAATVDLLVKGIRGLVQKNKITLLNGSASFVSAHEIAVVDSDGVETRHTAERFIVATGSVPVMLPSFGYDGQTVITSDQGLNLAELPQHMAIIGGGVIGCEFASIFRELGCDVTVIELMPALLPGMDGEISKQLASHFKRRGIKVLANTAVERIETDSAAGSARIFRQNGEPIEADKVLISIGRRSNTNGLALEKAGVVSNSRGRIMVDRFMRTNVPHIFAIGDVNDCSLDLAHVASAQGLVAAANAAGQSRAFAGDAVPSCVFTRPEIGVVGLTEEAAREQGIAVKTGKTLFRVLGKAQAMREIDGFVKLIVEEATDRVLGAHIIGPHASDLIAEATLAVRWGITAAQLGETIHAHPTLAEAIMESAEGAGGHAIHA